MGKTWDLKIVAWMVIVCCMMAAARPMPAADSSPSTGSRRDEGRVEARDAKRGRSVIFRAGELPRVLPKATEPAGGATKPILPTHYLDTLLPILIQGAPDELSLRRYMATG